MSANNSGTRCVSLFVPELLFGLDFLKNLPKQDIPHLPALQLLFSRAINNQDGDDNLYRGICELTGINVSAQQDLPLAAITISVENKSVAAIRADYYIFAEPVVMQADRDSLVLLQSLLPNNQDSLTQQESELLIAEVNLHFKDEPWQLHLGHQGSWYLVLKSKTAIVTTPSSEVFLKNTQHYIPVGDDARYWRRIINEIEMLFFASAVNAERVEKNCVTVTSLWLWGGGRLPSINHKSNCDIICGDEYLLQTISQFVDVPYKVFSRNLATNLIFSTDFNDLLFVNFELKDFWLRRDLYSWMKALKKMEQEIFNPVLTALRKGRLDNLNIFLDNKYKLQITRGRARRWWKPVKRLETLSDLL